MLTYLMDKVSKMWIDDQNDLVFRNNSKFYPKIVLHKIQEALNQLVYAFI